MPLVPSLQFGSSARTKASPFLAGLGEPYVSDGRVQKLLASSARRALDQDFGVSPLEI